MKALLLALLLALPFGSQAGSCKVPADSGTRYIHAGRINADWWVYWWCADGSLQWMPIVSEWVLPTVIEESAAYALGSKPTFPSFMFVPPDDDPVVMALEDAMRAAAAADNDRPPPPPVTGWFVANGGYPDRPMYSVTGGVRSTKANGERATVGDRCRCDPPYRIDEGRTTYCALDGRVPLAASFTVGVFSVSVCREVK